MKYFSATLQKNKSIKFRLVRVRDGATKDTSFSDDDATAEINKKKLLVAGGKYGIKAKEITKVSRPGNGDVIVEAVKEGKQMVVSLMGPPEPFYKFEPFVSKLELFAKEKDEFMEEDDQHQRTLNVHRNVKSRSRTFSRSPKFQHATRPRGKPVSMNTWVSSVNDEPDYMDESSVSSEAPASLPTDHQKTSDRQAVTTSPKRRKGQIDKEAESRGGQEAEVRDSDRESDSDDEGVYPSISRQHASKARRLRNTKIVQDDDSDEERSMTTPDQDTQRIVSPAAPVVKSASSAAPPSKTKSKKKSSMVSDFFKPRSSFDPSFSHPLTPKETQKETPKGSEVSKYFQPSQTENWLASRASSKESRKAQSPRHKLFDENILHDPVEEFSPERKATSSDPMGVLSTVPLKLARHPVTTARKRLRTNDLALRTPSSPLVANRLYKKEGFLTGSFGPRRPRHRGLRNLGNTCYMNSCIQMLTTLRDWPSRLEGRGGALTKSLTHAIHHLTDDLVSTSLPQVVNPKSLKSAMDRRTEKFAGFEQRDAHEFLSDTIDFIDEELRAGGQDDTSDAQSKSGLHYPTDDFRLDVEVGLTCQSCGYKRGKEEMYRHLSIDIVVENDGDVAKLPVSLEHFFRPEIRDLRCEKCQHGTHAKQTMKILSRPKALLLHLKRFVFVEKPILNAPSEGDENVHPNSPSAKRPSPSLAVEYVFQKKKNPVELLQTLSLAPFVAESDTMTKSLEYELSSLVYHYGSRASSGHYMADSSRPKLVEEESKAASSEKEDETTGAEVPSFRVDESTNEWVTFDDGHSGRTTLEKIQADNNKKGAAYLLLYILKPTKRT